MSAYKEGSVVFDITATEMAALDYTATTLYTLTVPSDRIWVPKLLKLRYKAGDSPFTITPNTYRTGDGREYQGDKNKFESPKATYRPHVTDYYDDDYLLFFFKKTPQNTATVQLDPDPIFAVNFRDLGLLETTDSAVIASPFNDGRNFYSDKTVFTVMGNGRSAYAGGTGGAVPLQAEGRIDGELFYEEHFVGR